MKDFATTLYHITKGYLPLLLWSLVAQVVMIFFTVFAVFLLQVLVDSLTSLESLTKDVSFLEKGVIWLLTGGRGAAYLYANRVYIMPLAIFAAGVLLALTTSLRMMLRSYLSSGVNGSMQYILFSHLERLPYSYYKRSKSGDLIQTSTRDIDVLRRFLVIDLGNFNYTFWMLLFCLLVLFALNWKLALVSISLLPAMFVYSFFLIKKVRKKYRATDDSEAVLTDKINENLLATRIIKAYNAERREIKGFDLLLDDYKYKFISWSRLRGFFFASSDIFVFGSKLLSLLFSAYLIFTGEIGAGTLVVAFLLIDMMVWPVRDTATSLSNMGRYLASADRVKEILDEKEEDVDSGLKPEIKGEIVFEDVRFHYPDSDLDMIDGVSFRVKAGSSLAIMGRTGAGKSTLAYLLTRLYDYDGGHIYLDGTEITKISKHHLRRNVMPVLQDPFLFSKSVAENIKMARPDASMEDVKKAVRMASLEATVSRLEKGYDTAVGEKGTSLSGGQKQRVAIARTLLASSPVLILDDSLSAVDTATDLKIRENLASMAKKPTTIIVTHRVMTAKDCDYIIVLDRGKVAEEGTHEELLKRPGLYQRIASIQGKMV